MVPVACAGMKPSAKTGKNTIFINSQAVAAMRYSQFSFVVTRSLPGTGEVLILNSGIDISQCLSVSSIGPMM